MEVVGSWRRVLMRCWIPSLAVFLRCSSRSRLVGLNQLNEWGVLSVSCVNIF